MEKTDFNTDSAPADKAYGIVAARSGAAALFQRLPDGGQRFVHSAYDPEKEALGWVDGCRLVGREACIVLGYGLGWHVRAMFERHPDISVLALASIADPQIAAADLCAERGGPDFTLIRRPAAGDVAALIASFAAAAGQRPLRVLFYMPAVKTDEAYYRTLLSAVYKVCYDEASRLAAEGVYLSRAAGLFCAAVSVAPEDWRSLYYLGLMQAGLGDYDSALISLGFAVRLCPNIAQKAGMVFTLARFNECLRAGERDFLLDLYSGIERDFAGTPQAGMAAKRLDVIRNAPPSSGKRAVFCMSTGRCGTMFLYELACRNLDGWDLGHEKHPVLFSPQGKGAVISGVLEKKDLFDASEHGLFETNHQFLKHYSHEARSAFGPALRVFHLVRDPVEVACSFAMRCSAPGRCGSWKGRDGSPYLRRFHLDPAKPHERRFMRHWRADWSMFESNLWECFEVHARAFEFADSLDPEQVFYLPFHRLNDEDAVSGFFAWVCGGEGAAVCGAHSADRHTNVVPTRVDDDLTAAYISWLESLPAADLAVVRRVLGRMAGNGSLSQGSPALAGLENCSPAAVCP